MENSSNHLDIINYLYDEMDPEEKRKFEERMEHDSALKEEVEAMMETRNSLGQMTDHDEIDIPVKATPSFIRQKQETFHWIKPLVSVAAVIMILLVTGYLTRFTIQYNEKGLLISFGETISNQYAEKSEVDRMIKEALSGQQTTFHRELTKTNDSLKSLSSLLTQYNHDLNKGTSTSRMVSEAELNEQIADWQKANQTLLQNYIQVVGKQQQEYMQDVLVQFSDYLQEQREKDLLMIRQNLIDLKDYQDQQKMETNQTLASIMKTVSQQK